MPSPEPQTLKAAFSAAERQREAIERGQVAVAANLGDAVAAALVAYERCAARIDLLALFSPNEAADDLATAHLPYLLVPLRIAELVQRLPVALDAGGNRDDDLPRARRALLRRARDAYERFLHQLDGYGLLAPPYARLLAAYGEAPGTFSLSGGGAGAGSSGDPTADAAARRNAKIASFRMEKALRDKLAALREQQQARRELQRRRRGGRGRQIRQTGGELQGGENDDDNDDSDDDNDDDDDDDEQARALALAELDYSAHLALQGLESLNREDAMLAQVRASDMHGGRDSSSSGRFGGLGDGRQRGREDSSNSGTADAEGRSGPANGPMLRQLQHMLGSTATVMGGGPRGAGNAGPLLTQDGKPRQPFTILGSRAERARAVFQTGHSLPTMSIDEYLEEERRRGGIVDGGGPSSGQAPEPDEDDHERADAETMKARAWDEFTEANPKGAGNTLNRG